MFMHFCTFFILELKGHDHDIRFQILHIRFLCLQCLTQIFPDSHTFTVNCQVISDTQNSDFFVLYLAHYYILFKNLLLTKNYKLYLAVFDIYTIWPYWSRPRA